MDAVSLLARKPVEAIALIDAEPVVFGRGLGPKLNDDRFPFLRLLLLFGCPLEPTDRRLDGTIVRP